MRQHLPSPHPGMGFGVLYRLFCISKHTHLGLRKTNKQTNKLQNNVWNEVWNKRRLCDLFSEGSSWETRVPRSYFTVRCNYLSLSGPVDLPCALSWTGGISVQLLFCRRTFSLPPGSCCHSCAMLKGSVYCSV